MVERVRVTRHPQSFPSLFGREWWWDVAVPGLFGGRIAIVRNWHDAMRIATLAANKMRTDSTPADPKGTQHE